MNFTAKEVIQYVREENVKFIRLAFCDVYGEQRNVAIMPSELERAFQYGIAVDGSAIPGFGGQVRSDLFLRPDPATLVQLPWRPESGKVVRMFCDITYPDGTVLENDTRSILKKAVTAAEKAGLCFRFGPEMEFYLFRVDEVGEVTRIPCDRAGYMAVAPEDRGENIRREICLNLEQMGIRPESSHHEEGPGQNEIDFRHSDPLSAADNTISFRGVVKNVAWRNGFAADFSPKPLPDQPGNGMHINLSAGSKDMLVPVIAGIMKHIREITLFLNPSESSYHRFGAAKAPAYVSWSSENRSQLIRIPAAHEEGQRAELRSPDSGANPYIAFALLIYAGLEGVRQNLLPPDPVDRNLYTADAETLRTMERLPENLQEAFALAEKSAFVRSVLPESLLEAYRP